MHFIEAGIDHPQENKFRKLSPKRVFNTILTVGKKVNKTFQGKGSSGINKCNKGFEPLTSSSKSTPFTEGLSLKGDSPKEKIRKNNNPKLELIPIKSIKIEDIGPTIDTIKLMGTSRKIKDISKPFSIPYQTMYYNGEGKGYQSVPKGTQIEYSSPTICSLYDTKTGKYQAYAKIKSFTKPIGTNGKDFDSISAGFIRTPWFDGVVNKKEPAFIKSPEKKSETLSFSGYLGPDGREIPAYILKAVTVNYFGKKIVPKVAETIQKTDQKINMARDIMKNEYLNKKIPLKETSAYKIQIRQLAEKGKMESIHTSLTKFTLNNGNIYDTNTVKIMNSIQKSTDWEVIKQQAAFVYRQKITGKI